MTLNYSTLYGKYKMCMTCIFYLGMCNIYHVFMERQYLALSLVCLTA